MGTTTSHEETKVHGDSEQDISNGFHMVEVHIPTIAKGGTILFVILAVVGLFYWSCRNVKRDRRLRAQPPLLPMTMPMPMPPMYHPNWPPHFERRQRFRPGFLEELEMPLAAPLTARPPPRPLPSPSPSAAAMPPAASFETVSTQTDRPHFRFNDA